MERAIDLLLQAKSIQQKEFAGGSPALARTFTNLGVAYWRAKRFAESKDSYESAIRAYGSMQGASAPHFASCLHQYAALLRVMQNFGEAEQAEVRATRQDVQSVLQGQPASPEASVIQSRTERHPTADSFDQQSAFRAVQPVPAALSSLSK